MTEPRILLTKDRMAVMISRLAYQLYENYDDFENTVIIGLQPRGIIFARRLHGMLQTISGNFSIPFGELDVTFHRDDFRRSDEPLIPSINSMNFLIEKKN